MNLKHTDKSASSIGDTNRENTSKPVRLNLNNKRIALVKGKSFEVTNRKLDDQKDESPNFGQEYVNNDSSKDLQRVVVLQNENTQS